MGCYTHLLSSGTVPLAFFEHFYKTKKGKNTCRSLILGFNRQSGIAVWNVKLLMSTCRTKLNFQIFYLFIYLSGLKVILVPVIFLVKALWWKDFEALFINLILKEHSFEVKKKTNKALYFSLLIRFSYLEWAWGFKRNKRKAATPIACNILSTVPIYAFSSHPNTPHSCSVQKNMGNLYESVVSFVHQKCHGVRNGLNSASSHVIVQSLVASPRKPFRVPV